VLANGNVKCWGNNTYGQLGQGDTVDRGTGAATDPGMGDALAPIDLGSGVAAVAVAAGMLHTCYLLSDNSVKCCGSNTVGQLGYDDWRDRCNGVASDMGDALPIVALD